MKNVVGQIVSALDGARHIKLLAISFDGAVIRFITSEDSGSPTVTKSIDTVQDWFGKHGLGEDQGNPQGQETPRFR